LRKRTTPDFAAAAVVEIVEGKPVTVVAKHARVERSTVDRWIERYLAERAP
jgi:transposase